MHKGLAIRLGALGLLAAAAMALVATPPAGASQCTDNCVNELFTCTHIHPGPPVQVCQEIYEECLAHCS